MYGVYVYGGKYAIFSNRWDEWRESDKTCQEIWIYNNHTYYSIDISSKLLDQNIDIGVAIQSFISILPHSDAIWRQGYRPTMIHIVDC